MLQWAGLKHGWEAGLTGWFVGYSDEFCCCAEALDNICLKVLVLWQVLVLKAWKFKFSREQCPREKFPTEKFPKEKFPREKFPREKFPREIFSILSPIFLIFLNSNNVTFF